MLSKSIVLATLLALASAGPCRPRPSGASPTPSPSAAPSTAATGPSSTGAAAPSSTGAAGPSPSNGPDTAVPTLPSTGGAELPGPDPSLKLLHIALGHGLQNYTCEQGVEKAASAGALAVLYDVTGLYPGSPSGLTQDAFDGLTFDALWETDIPLNLADPAAAKPGTPANPNVLPEASYGATTDPFPAPADLVLAAAGSAPVPFLGHHYFEAGVPTFDLSAAGKVMRAAKVGGVSPPAGADGGILGTGAVDWLQLKDNGASQGVKMVYRVVTAGGNAQACSVSGAGAGSVPYTALYWFYA